MTPTEILDHIAKSVVFYGLYYIPNPIIPPGKPCWSISFSFKDKQGEPIHLYGNSPERVIMEADKYISKRLKPTIPIGTIVYDIRFRSQIMEVTGYTKDRYNHPLLKVHSLSGHNTTTVSPHNVELHK